MMSEMVGMPCPNEKMLPRHVQSGLKKTVRSSSTKVLAFIHTCVLKILTNCGLWVHPRKRETVLDTANTLISYAPIRIGVAKF